MFEALPVLFFLICKNTDIGTREWRTLQYLIDPILIRFVSVERVFFFCCIGSFHSAEMKKYTDTLSHAQIQIRKYYWLQQQNKKRTKPTKNMASGLHVRACPSLKILMKLEQVQKCGFAIIWRNCPYIGGHLALFFKLIFEHMY